MDYSDSHFNAMREDALRRVREMQQRSRSIVSGEAPPPPPDKAAAPDLSSLFGIGKGDKKDKGLFSIGGISIDEEKAMIALLIYILYKQGADIKLLLCLGYLLL